MSSGSEVLSSLVFDKITPSQCQQVTTIVNDAFQKDAFFKKPEYFDRETLENVEKIAADTEQTFVVGFINDVVYAAILVAWIVDITMVLEDGSTQPIRSSVNDLVSRDSALYHTLSQAKSLRFHLTGHLSEVSVDPKLTRCGIGKKLVAAAEGYTCAEAARLAQLLEAHAGIPTEHACATDMIVLDVRPELKPWYMRQGYACLSDGDDFAWSFICREGFVVKTCHLKKALAGKE
jgi:GNAT superfamily N-acetyltransferase